MVHGAYDAVMPPYTGLAFVQSARKAGDSADVVTVPDAGHFDVVIPTRPALGRDRGHRRAPRDAGPAALRPAGGFPLH